MKPSNWLCFSVFLLAGCRGADSGYFPTTVGTTYSYSARSTRQSFVANYKVTRHLPVANTEGIEMVGDLGVSRLAWRGDQLMASELGGSFYSPAIPILDKSAPVKPAQEDTSKPPITPIRWDGEVYSPNAVAATAFLVHEKTTTPYEGRNVPALKSTITFDLAGHEMLLETWFVDGVGIVRQEQHTDHAMDMNLTLLSRKSG